MYRLVFFDNEKVSYDEKPFHSLEDCIAEGETFLIDGIHNAYQIYEDGIPVQNVRVGKVNITITEKHNNVFNLKDIESILKALGKRNIIARIHKVINNKAFIYVTD